LKWHLDEATQTGGNFGLKMENGGAEQSISTTGDSFDGKK
jgi:hypothetical protein